jgi:hypothetical protein
MERHARRAAAPLIETGAARRHRDIRSSLFVYGCRMKAIPRYRVLVGAGIISRLCEP